MFTKVTRLAAIAVVSVGISAPAFAGKLAMFDTGTGWTEFQDLHSFNNLPEDGQVGPGVGGQKFDAEYLFYKQTGNTISIALQTGYDVVDGNIYYQGKDYYAGDLALSFDGNVTSDSSTYEYGVDFGLYTEDYTDGNTVDFTSGTGVDPAGLYEVASWNDGVYAGHGIANPLAIDSIVGGSFVSTLQSSGFGFAGGQKSFYRIVSFDATGLVNNGDIIDVHWTMSCGNDEINGSFVANVPEPESVAMVLLGLLGLGLARMRRNKIVVA